MVEKEEERVRENFVGSLWVCVPVPQGRSSPPILLTHPSPPTPIPDTHTQKQCLLSYRGTPHPVTQPFPLPQEPLPQTVFSRYGGV